MNANDIAEMELRYPDDWRLPCPLKRRIDLLILATKDSFVIGCGVRRWMRPGCQNCRLKLNALFLQRAAFRLIPCWALLHLSRRDKQATVNCWHPTARLGKRTRDLKKPAFPLFNSPSTPTPQGRWPPLCAMARRRWYFSWGR